VTTDDGAGARPSVWRRADSAAYVESSAGTPPRAVVLDLDHLDHPPYVFEGPAALIWEHVDGERSESQIAAELAEAFETPVVVVAADVRQFLDRLRELRLVVDRDAV
jgi:pyrroloquinoline quinone biosynthesis protein D